MDLKTMQQLFCEAKKEQDFKNVFKYGEQLLEIEESSELSHDEILETFASLSVGNSLENVENVEKYFNSVKNVSDKMREILVRQYYTYASNLKKSKENTTKITEIAKRGLENGLTKYELRQLKSLKYADKEYFSTWDEEINAISQQNASEKLRNAVSNIIIERAKKVDGIYSVKKVDEGFAIERFKQFLAKKYGEDKEYIQALISEDAKAEVKLYFNKVRAVKYTRSGARYQVSYHSCYDTDRGYTRTGELTFNPKTGEELHTLGVLEDINEITEDYKSTELEFYKDVELIDFNDVLPKPKKIRLEDPDKYEIERTAQSLFNQTMYWFKYITLENGRITAEKLLDSHVPVYSIVIKNGNYAVKGYINGTGTTKACVKLLTEEKDGICREIFNGTNKKTKEKTKKEARVGKKSFSVFSVIALLAQFVPWIISKAQVGGKFITFTLIANVLFVISLFIKNSVVRRILRIISFLIIAFIIYLFFAV